MGSNAAKRARKLEEQQKREELSAKWQTNLQEINEVLSARLEELTEDDQIAVAFFKAFPYEVTIPMEKLSSQADTKTSRPYRILINANF